MVRTTTATRQLCKDCGDVPREEGPRCLPCHRKWKAAAKRNRNLRKNQDRLKQNGELAKKGKRICTKCFRVRQLTEYRTSQPHRKGKINKICDECLSRAYSYRGHGLDYKYWRRRAYSVNCAARIRLATQRNVAAKTLTFADLDYECKPQDLQELHNRDPLCRYCRRELTAETLTVDHMHPVSRGGAHCLKNMTLCCRDCNHLKHTRTHPEFVQFLHEYAAQLSEVVEQQDKQPAG